MIQAVQSNQTNQTQKQKNNTEKRDYVFAVGRRREAIARVRLYQNEKEGLSWGEVIVKKGDILVNMQPGGKYFTSIAYTQLIEPLRVTNTLQKFAFTIKVEGGGKEGQLDAAIHGIARALDKVDKEKFHPILRKKWFLTRDSRTRQRRKVGMGGKSRRKKQSPKR